MYEKTRCGCNCVRDWQIKNKSKLQGLWEVCVIPNAFLLSASNQGYEGDFMSTVHLEYDCCEELHVQFNISSLSLNTSFKHIESHLDDLKIASLRISDVETLIREQEWKRLHTSAHHTYSTLAYIFLLLIGLYILYKLYSCLKGKSSCVKSLTDASGSGNVVNIKIYTSNEILAVAQEDVPLRELNSGTPNAKPRRSNTLRTTKSCF